MGVTIDVNRLHMVLRAARGLLCRAQVVLGDAVDHRTLIGEAVERIDRVAVWHVPGWTDPPSVIEPVEVPRLSVHDGLARMLLEDADTTSVTVTLSWHPSQEGIVTVEASADQDDEPWALTENAYTIEQALVHLLALIHEHRASAD